MSEKPPKGASSKLEQKTEDTFEVLARELTPAEEKWVVNRVNGVPSQLTKSNRSRLHKLGLTTQQVNQITPMKAIFLIEKENERKEEVKKRSLPDQASAVAIPAETEQAPQPQSESEAETEPKPKRERKPKAKSEEEPKPQAKNESELRTPDGIVRYLDQRLLGVTTHLQNQGSALSTVQLKGLLERAKKLVSGELRSADEKDLLGQLRGVESSFEKVAHNLLNGIGGVESPKTSRPRKVGKPGSVKSAEPQTASLTDTTEMMHNTVMHEGMESPKSVQKMDEFISSTDEKGKLRALIADLDRQLGRTSGFRADRIEQQAIQAENKLRDLMGPNESVPQPETSTTSPSQGVAAAELESHPAASTERSQPAPYTIKQKNGATVTVSYGESFKKDLQTPEVVTAPEKGPKVTYDESFVRNLKGFNTSPENTPAEGAETQTAEPETIEPIRPLDLESIISANPDNLGEAITAETTRYFNELNERLPWVSPLIRDLYRARSDIEYDAAHLKEAKNDRQRNKLLKQIREQAAEMLAVGAVIMDQIGFHESSATGKTYESKGAVEAAEKRDHEEERKETKKKTRRGLLGLLGITGIAAGLAALLSGDAEQANSPVQPTHAESTVKKEGAAKIVARVQPTAAEISKNHGAEEALTRLQKQLKAFYVHTTANAVPRNVQYIMHTPAHKIADAMHFYDHANKESRIMKIDEYFTVDAKGILRFKPTGQSKEVVLLGEQPDALLHPTQIEGTYRLPHAHEQATRVASAQPQAHVTYDSQAETLAREVAAPAHSDEPATQPATKSNQSSANVRPVMQSLDDFVQSHSDNAPVTDQAPSAARDSTVVPPPSGNSQRLPSLDEWTQERSGGTDN